MQSKPPFHALAAAVAALCCVLAMPAVAAAGDPIRLELFNGYSEAPGVGISFSGPVREEQVADINFGSSAPWWPITGASESFGARLTSGLLASTAGSYTFTLGGDDATYLFINGNLVLSQPGNHSYFTSQVTVALAAGTHAMELQFYNGPCCGSQLTLDPGGLAYVAAIPEPGTAALWLAGLGLAGWAARRRAAAAG